MVQTLAVVWREQAVVYLVSLMEPLQLLYLSKGAHLVKKQSWVNK